MTERPSRAAKFADLRVRLLSGLALAAVSYVCIRIGGVWSGFLVVALVVMMQWEFRRIAVPSTDAIMSPALAVVLAGCLAGIVLILAGSKVPGLALVVAGAIASGLMTSERRAEVALGAAYLGIAMCVLLILRIGRPEGLSIILWLVLVVIASDAGAFFVGRSVGGARLWPSVSPGKTRSGAIGGMVIAGLVSLIVGVLLGWNLLNCLVLGLLVAAGSQFGDLLESAFKRRHGVKDSSDLIPGHGGFLDRFDGIIGGTWVFLALDLAGFSLTGT